MAVLISTDLNPVTLWYRGKPFINVEASSTANTQTNFESGLTLPTYLSRLGGFYGALGSAATITTNNIYAKINGEWVLISNAYVYIGTPGSGAWKSIESDKMFVKTTPGWRS